jgi:hypothetical protein
MATVIPAARRPVTRWRPVESIPGRCRRSWAIARSRTRLSIPRWLTSVSATFGANEQVRSSQLKRDQRSFSRSRVHRQVNGRGYTSQFCRYGSANPVDAGVQRRQMPCTRERLYRLALSASWVSNIKKNRLSPRSIQARNQEWPFFDMSKAMSRQPTALLWRHGSGSATYGANEPRRRNFYASIFSIHCRTSPDRDDCCYRCFGAGSKTHVSVLLQCTNMCHRVQLARLQKV